VIHQRPGFTRKSFHPLAPERLPPADNLVLSVAVRLKRERIGIDFLPTARRVMANRLRSRSWIVRDLWGFSPSLSGAAELEKVRVHRPSAPKEKKSSRICHYPRVDSE